MSSTTPLPYGQILTDKRHRRSDLRLIERAVRNGWVPADRRDEIVRQVAAVPADDPTPRERIAVARVTTVMTRRPTARGDGKGRG